jgi:hypothetical protein
VINIIERTGLRRLAGFIVAAPVAAAALTAGAAPATADDEPASATISGFLWQDLNGDGQQQDGEPGLPAANVVLAEVGADGVPSAVDSTSTSTTGRYEFSAVQGKRYYVAVIVENGSTVVTRANIGDDATDSDLTDKPTGAPTVVFGASDEFVLGAAGQHIDGGFAPAPETPAAR